MRGPPVLWINRVLSPEEQVRMAEEFAGLLSNSS